jgi:hypothetical protein
MKTIKDKIKKLIQSSTTQKKITKRDYENFSKVFDFYLELEIEKADEENRIVSRLHSILQKRKEYQEKLNDSTKINYFGEYLFTYLSYNNLTYADVSEKVEIDQTLLKRLVENKIKLIDVSPASMARLIKYLNLKFESVKELIIKTIILNYGKASAKQSLARYSVKKGLDEKGKSMSSAVNELLLKAHNSKPINFIKSDLQEEADLYLKELEKAIYES